MISKSYILDTLKMLDRKYRNASTPKESLFYSKLAILELCGWIEESMDDVVLRCANRHLKVVSNVTHFKNKIVKKTYGFDYQHNFRRMIIQLLGLVNVERIEKRVNQTKQAHLIATLSALKLVRNAEAHTHIKGVTRNINAPSVTLNQFPALYGGLIEIDAVMRRTKF